MENKINIAKLLKDCPKGMELDCTMYDNLYFDRVDEKYKLPISCYTMYHGSETPVFFTEFGSYNEYKTAKCVIFPKGKTTWEGFQRTFKDGDILIGKTGHPFIFKSLNNSYGCCSYCGIDLFNNFKLDSNDWTFANSLRFATEAEKQELFQTIENNGYKWNAETKTLEELVPNKFDIKTLKPFDKVLVRDKKTDEWRGHFFSHYDSNSDRPYVCIGVEGINEYKRCIPYVGNEHLLGRC